MTALHKLHSALKPLTFNTERDSIAIEPALKKYLRFYSIDFESKYSVDHHMGKMEAAGFNIACQYWTLAQARGTVFIFHGHYDHVGLNRQVIQWCLNEHYNVVTLDFPGHGLSTGPQASIESFDQYGEVLNTLMTRCSGKMEKPHYCIAQGSGAAAVLNMMWKQKRRPFAKIAFLAPLVRSQISFKEKIEHFRAGLSGKTVERSFVVNSGDKKFTRFVRTGDPLQAKILPAKWVSAMKKWAKTLPKMPIEIMSILVVQGDKDAMVDWKYSIKQMSIHFPNAAIKYLKGGRHNLVNECGTIRKAIFREIKNYFDQ